MKKKVAIILALVMVFGALTASNCFAAWQVFVMYWESEPQEALHK